MPRASKSDRSQHRPLDITDIMRPTAGVIDFDQTSEQSYTYSSPDWASTPSPASPSFPSTPTGDCAWNLIPYHIPWGNEYHDYRRGKLPGPEGDCIFLRSPTPIKNQRTSEACKKCRERKAKCSGEHPSCARCATRGFTCEYASAEFDEPTVPKERKRKREPSVASSASSSSSPHTPAYPVIVPSNAPVVQPSHPQERAIKREEVTPAYCQSPIPGPYWDSPNVPDTGEEWSVVYPSAHFAGEVYPAGATYGLPLYYGHRLPSPGPSLFAPQPIRRSSVSDLEFPMDTSSEGSFSSGATDASGAFMSGTLTPLSSEPSAAPSPGAEYGLYPHLRSHAVQYACAGFGAQPTMPLGSYWAPRDPAEPYFEDMASSAPYDVAAYVTFT
ncbi:unnamed protein product [Peniophora sp. CBMAI 1063]|nr:unnamed protein product [Peniophora sp. CBMAI 1063]